VALSLALPLAACDLERPEETTTAPPPRVLAVHATTGIDSAGEPVLERIDVDASKSVLTTAHFELRFDRYLAPRDVSRQALCLRSAPEPVESYEDCIGGVALRPSYDPVRRVARFYLEGPAARLAPDTLYTLSVHVPRGDADLGFRAFDGAPLELGLELRFRTDADPRIDARADGPPEGRRYCSDEHCVRRCMGEVLCLARCAPGAREVLASCAGGRCHGERAEGGAAMGLALDGEEALLSTAIEKVAHQTQVGPDADTPKINPLRFGSQMMLIAPGDAGSSYLLYKLLVHPEFDRVDDGLAPGELERLRSFVVGMPMPLSGPRSAREQAEALSDWIAAGADVEACP